MLSCHLNRRHNHYRYWYRQISGSLYERDDIIPSVENAKKIAQALGVSLDYLVSEDDSLEVVDVDMLNRMLEIQRLAEDDKTTVLKIIDAFIRDTKTKKAYA